MDQERTPDQVNKTQREEAYVACSCCGKLIENSKEQNASFGEEPYPHDQGFGMCFECGGDPNSDDFRTKLGWAGQTFFDTRIRIVRKHLHPRNLARFDAMPYERQVGFVGYLIDSGVMI